jgi:hypothetical protein
MNGFSEPGIKCLHRQDSLQIPETRMSFHFRKRDLRNMNSSAIPGASLATGVGEMTTEDHGSAVFGFEARFQIR